MSESTDIPLIIFAKAPIAGRVKTRLMDSCTAQQAADIAEILLEQSLQKASLSWPGKVLLSVGLDQDHPFLQRMQQRFKVELVAQCEGDLGVRMHASLDHFGYPAAILGADAPHVRADCLLRAHHTLNEGRSVLGPSDDGGYYLIGLSQNDQAIFTQMPWGTSDVLQCTIDRAQRRFTLLESLIDVDRWPDVLDVAHELPALQGYLEQQKLT